MLEQAGLKIPVVQKLLMLLDASRSLYMVLSRVEENAHVQVASESENFNFKSQL